VEKKSLTAAERNPYKRAWYWRKMKQVSHPRLKFLDEAGVTTTLTRRFGRAAPEERIGEAVPKNYGPSTSVVSVIGVGGVETAMVIEGAVDTWVFEAFCEQCLRPCLRDGDILVLDNLGAHRASRVEEIAQARHARVIWLPPDSPAFSPIEPMWGKLKTHLPNSKPGPPPISNARWLRGCA
jgi:transposase